MEHTESAAAGAFTLASLQQSHAFRPITERTLFRDGKGERAMEESRGQRPLRRSAPAPEGGYPRSGWMDARGGEAEIGMLRRQTVALADADRVLPEDGRALLAALDAALLELRTGDLPAAQAEIERFVAGAQRLIEAGVLAGREGHPPLTAARALLAELRGSVRNTQR